MKQQLQIAQWPGFLFKGISIFLFLVFTNSLFSQTNLITNSGFESGTTGWSVWGATMASTTDAHSGTQAVQISNRKNSWDALVWDLSGTLVSGQTYTLGVWVKILNPAVDFRATLSLNVGGTTSYNGYLWTGTPTIGSYAYYTQNITPTWTGVLTSANLYFETGSVDDVYPDYIVDDVTLIGLTPEPEPVIDSRGWKDIKSPIRVGACATDGSKTYFNNATAKAVLLKDCNSVNLQCYPAWGRWDETLKNVYHIDAFSSQVKEMKKQNIVVTAHMLLGWDQYFPNWYKQNNFSADTLDMFMKSWLDAIIGSNGNDTLVDIWNVVNEAISWNGSGGYWPEYNANFNDACELQRMGYEPDESGLTGTMKVNSQHPVYIRKAFEYARTLTDKKLELRDASFEFPTDSKYRAFYQLAVHLKKVGAPVDVIGFQTHLDLERIYDWDGYANNIKRYVKLGYQVNIPEVDVGDVNKSWTDDKAELQKNQYYRLVTSAIKGGASDFQTWGINDENNSSWRAGQKGLTYTNSFQPKPAYFGVREALIDMSHILFWEMDAAVNDTMPDVMKYNNFGLLNNFGTPVLVSGFKSKALQFDGVDDYISTGNLSDSISGDFTFSCFIKTSASGPAVLADLSGEGASGINIWLAADGTVFIDASAPGLSQNLAGATAVNDGKWHFIALQRDSATYRLYIDGAVAAASADGNIFKFNRLVLGAKNDQSSAFSGIVDEVRLYDTAIEEASLNRSMVPFCPLKLSVTKKTMAMRFAWLDQSNNEEGFLIERKIGDGAWEERGTVGANVLIYLDTLKLYNTQYIFRVRAINKFGYSTPSNSVTILSPLDPATGISPAKIDDDLLASAFPNPVVSSLTLVSPNNAAMKIFDIHGRFLMEKNDLSGIENIDLSSFANGIYFMKLISGEKSSVIKIIKN